ncbi:MAG TPA: efflux RND transporter periplasmic adaptor subunit [bacterium]|nr:efflux RND transporter periplasmic adaptor subunit [bacterium]
MRSFRKTLVSTVLLSRPSPLSLIALAALAAGLLTVTGCSSEKKKATPQLAVPVIVTAAMEKNVPVTLKAIGSVEAYNTVSIRARIGGALTRVAFKEGQDVKQGDLLFVIDPRPYQNALQAVLAALARDRAQAANAEADARRYAELIQKGYVARQQYDQVATTAEALKATVQSDEAAVEIARLNLQYCNILAPISGRTGNLMVHQGDQIKADDIAMVVINQITPINASFSIPEQSLPEIRKYASAGSLTVEASFPNDTGKPTKGELTFINNTVDLSTRTILLKATFPNTDKRLWPGQFVNVNLTLTTRSHAVVIPTQALQAGQQGPFVFVIKPDLTAESRPITPGQESNGETLIEKGLQAGEKVVTDGQLRLVPGARVEIRPGLELGGVVTP